MASIIRGTTPTILYTFQTVSVADISEAYLTIKIWNNTVIEKTLEDATVGEDSLSWTLTQEETLSMTRNDISVMLNWKTFDGVRGASKPTNIVIYSNQKEVVI